MAKHALKVKMKASTLPVPQTREETSETIAEIGRLDRALQRIDADLKDALAAVKEQYETAAGGGAAPLAVRRGALSEGVKAFCEGRRGELTKDGKSKTVPFPAGVVSWRDAPPSVTWRGVKVDELIAIFKSLRLRKFIRVKEEVNKEAILDNPKAAARVKELKIGSAGEAFVIEPYSPDGIEGAKS
ncbi:MAG: host-nuclease inhibitor Gam family protein [Gammaproteobacteria bacterium]